MSTVAVVIHRIQFLHAGSSLGNVRDARLSDAFAAANQVHNGVGELMRNEARAFVGIVALISLANDFAILGRLQVPQTRFDRHAAVTRLNAAERDELRINCWDCPGFRLNVTWTAEFSERVETSADQGQSAGVVEVVPQHLVECCQQRRRFRIRRGGLKFRDCDFYANNAFVRSRIESSLRLWCGHSNGNSNEEKRKCQFSSHREYSK